MTKQLEEISVPDFQNANSIKVLLPKIGAKLFNPQDTPAREWTEFAQLHELVSELIKLQNDEEFPEIPAYSDIDFQPFLSWLKSEGVVLDKIELLKSPNYGNGVFAVRNIKKDEKLIEIPTRLMLTSHISEDNPCAAMISASKILQLIPSLSLALHILSEKFMPNSFWRPYLDILPKSFDIPLFWSIEDLSLLKGSPIQSESIKIYKSTTRQYLHLLDLLQKLPNPPIQPQLFTFAAFRWAVAVVMTRQNNIPIIENEGKNSHRTAVALIPVFDMPNHKAGEITTYFDPETKTSEIFAPHDIKKGEEIFMAYGMRGNADLLLYSGFIDPTYTTYDAYKVWVGIPNGDPSFVKRKAILEKCGLPHAGNLDLPRAPFYPVSTSEVSIPLAQPLLVFLRVLFLPSDMLYKYHGPNATISELLVRGGIGWEIERKVLEWIQTRTDIVLKGFPHEFSTNEIKYLRKRKEMAIQLRHLEKQMILNAKKETQMRLEEMTAMGV